MSAITRRFEALSLVFLSKSLLPLKRGDFYTDMFRHIRGRTVSVRKEMPKSAQLHLLFQAGKYPPFLPHSKRSWIEE